MPNVEDLEKSEELERNEQIEGKSFLDKINVIFISISFVLFLILSIIYLLK